MNLDSLTLLQLIEENRRLWKLIRGAYDESAPSEFMEIIDEVRRMSDVVHDALNERKHQIRREVFADLPDQLAWPLVNAGYETREMVLKDYPQTLERKLKPFGLGHQRVREARDMIDQNTICPTCSGTGKVKSHHHG